MTDDTYVTHANWLRHGGRPDLIDEVADQFERPVSDGAQAFWTGDEIVEWPRGSRGWHSIDHRYPRRLERRAG